MPDVRTTAMPVKPMELRIKAEEPPPAQPADPPAPRMDVHASPPAKPDAASVQALRALLERQPEEEVREQLKPYDPATQEALFILLGNVAQLEQGGGVAQLRRATWPPGRIVCTP